MIKNRNLKLENALLDYKELKRILKERQITIDEYRVINYLANMYDFNEIKHKYTPMEGIGYLSGVSIYSVLEIDKTKFCRIQESLNKKGYLEIGWLDRRTNKVVPTEKAVLMVNEIHMYFNNLKDFSYE